MKKYYLYQLFVRTCKVTNWLYLEDVQYIADRKACMEGAGCAVRTWQNFIHEERKFKEINRPIGICIVKYSTTGKTYNKPMLFDSQTILLK